MPSISVRVPVTSVIAKLEARLKEINEAEQKNEKIVAQNNEAEQKYKEKLLKVTVDASVSRVEHQRYWHRTNDNMAEIEVTYKVPQSKVPTAPVRKSTVPVPKYKEEIMSAISLLNMTEDTVVSASTFKQISKLL